MLKMTDVAIANAIIRARALAGIEAGEAETVADILLRASQALLDDCLQTGSPIDRDQSEILRAVSMTIQDKCS